MAKQEITLKGLDGHEDHLVYDAANGKMSGSLEDCARSLFPAEGETTPRLRFQGFEGEWEKKLLSDCLEISDEKNTENLYGIDDVLSVSDDFGVVNQIELLGRSYAGKSVSGYKILRPGQIVYTKSPLRQKPYGIVKVNRGKTGIVSVLYAVYNVKEGVSAEYLHYYFDPAWRLNAYMRPLVNKGAKNTMNISDETALTGYIMIPKDVAEQERIASLLQRLDSQISMHHQQFERLKELKSACLGSMFPRESQITPPIRFSGYEDEWETVALKDICEINPSCSLPEQFDYVDLESVVGTTMISHRKVHKVSAPSRAQRLAKDGDIFYQTVRPYQKNNYLFQDMGTPFVFSTGYAQLRTWLNSAFIFTALQTDSFVNQVLDNCTGTSYPAINSTSLSKLTLKITKNIDEQKSIALFFKDIDSQITTEQRRLDKLKQIKYACLRSMFPQSNEITPPHSVHRV